MSTDRTMPPQGLERLRESCSSALPTPGLEEIEEAIRLVTAFVRDDFQNLPASPVGKTASRAQMEALLRQPPPEEGLAFARVMEEFKEKVVPYAYRAHHPRFLAFVPGAPTMLSILGDWLCAGINFFCGVWKEAPGAAEVEILVLDWFKEFLGYPEEAAGALTGGGSEANLIALVLAREAIPKKERANLRAYVCGQRHWSIDRAFLVMGLDTEMVCPIPVDEMGRMRVAALVETIERDRSRGMKPWLVVANAGATNTGAVDPIRDISAVCREHGLWLHVDAAYGWSAILSEKQKHVLDGIGQANSLTLDPHKWFAQPFEVGCVLVRQGERLTKTFQMRPEYMQDVAPREDEVNFSDRGIALTRRFRALKIWLSLKVMGVGWFRNLVDHCCALAEYSAAMLRARGGFEIVNPPSLSVLCFRYVPLGFGGSAGKLDEMNLKVCEGVRETGKAFLSTTRLKGQVCLRFCFVNYRTTAGDVEEIVQLLEEVGKEIVRAGE